MASPPSIRWQCFHAPKAGNAAEDYEDAASGDSERLRFAVADGASEASFAELWARLLVNRFVAEDGKPWRNFDWIDAIRQQWAATVDGLELPWYAEQKRLLGAFATFLGFSLQRFANENSGRWRALAVGDCCIVHTRSDQILRSFPMTQATEFGNSPSLLRSRANPSASDGIECLQARGRWRSMDRFLLMTDALAQWFLLQNERQKHPLGEIEQLLADSSPGSAFSQWIDVCRRDASLRNDDVTLLIVDMQPVKTVQRQP